MKGTGVIWTSRPPASAHPERALIAFLIAAGAAAGAAAGVPAGAPAGTARGTLATVMTANAALDQTAGNNLVPLTASAPPRLPANAIPFGVLPPSKAMTVQVTLKPRNHAELKAYLDGLANPNSPYYHRYLTPAQFTAEFGPTAQQVNKVKATLGDAGLTPGQVAANHLAIPVAAIAGQLERAFHITLVTYAVGGRIVYSNTTAPLISADVAPLVQGVIGLNNLYPAHAAQPGSGGFIQAPVGS
jgi:pseudomonalisin